MLVLALEQGLFGAGIGGKAFSPHWVTILNEMESISEL